ncbi:MAG TPA: glycosyltransferase family 87 protein [Planctomycetota bacterium]|nr:glycosyltransferase family 87 protein [Planctomycetota bacterium]
MSATQSLRTFRVAAWLVIALACAWEFKVTLKNAWASPKDPAASKERISDFAAYYSAGTLALRGQDIYDSSILGNGRRPYIYPPTFAIFPMMPLALLPQNAALIVFVLINYALLFGLCWLLRDALWRLSGAAPNGGKSAAAPAWRQFLLEPAIGVMLAVIVCFRFFDDNNRQVNSNLYVAFALVLAMWWMLRRKARFDFAAGLSIALATAIKVTPGLFGLYLLWSWRPWAMLGGAVGLVVFLVLVPSARYGFTDGIGLLKKYENHVVAAETGENAENDPIGVPGGHEKKQLEGGISLRGTLMRYLTPLKMTLQYSKDEVRDTYINILNLDSGTARKIAHGLEFLFLALTIALTVRAYARHDPGAVALSWGLVTMTMLLIAPLTRKAHLCAAMLPIAAMIALMQQGRIRGWARRLCIAALVYTCLEGAIFSVEFIGKWNADRIQLAGGLWYLLGLYAANACALVSIRASVTQCH